MIKAIQSGIRKIIAGPDAAVDATEEKLRAALGAAKDALATALQAMIANDIYTERGRLENAFESAKNALEREPKLAHLEQAAKDLKLAVDLLSNHSLKNGADLTAIKEAHATATSAVTSPP